MRLWTIILIIASAFGYGESGWLRPWGRCMSVYRTGSDVEITTTTGNSSQGAITIPDGTDLVVVVVAGFTIANPSLTELGWTDGVHSFTFEATTDVGNDPRVELWWMRSSDVGWPGTGAGKTLYWQANGPIFSGLLMHVMFMGGVTSAGDPIIEAVVDAWGADDANCDITDLGVLDRVYGAAVESGTVGDGDTAGATALRETIFNGAGLVVAENDAAQDGTMTITRSGAVSTAGIFWAVDGVLSRGIEFRVPDNRPHYQIPDNRPHYKINDNRIHVKVRRNDD